MTSPECLTFKIKTYIKATAYESLYVYYSEMPAVQSKSGSEFGNKPQCPLTIKMNWTESFICYSIIVVLILTF